MPSGISTVSGSDVQILLSKLARAEMFLPFSNSENVPLYDWSSPQKRRDEKSISDEYCAGEIGEGVTSKRSCLVTTTAQATQKQRHCNHQRQRKQGPPKHILQLESITQHLQSNNLLRAGTTFCELGCGTAKLSDHVSAHMSRLQESSSAASCCNKLDDDGSPVQKHRQAFCSYKLIDRKTFNPKRLRDRAIAARIRSNKGTNRDSGVETDGCQMKKHPPMGAVAGKVERISMDIGDISDITLICADKRWNNDTTTTLDDPHANNNNVVVISKHLCGSAADFSIRCCAPKLVPMVVATCCHYLCAWDDFSNTPFFKTLGFTERDFQVLTIVSQWASIRTASKRLGSSVGGQESETKDIGVSNCLPRSKGCWLKLLPLPQLPECIENLEIANSMVESNEFEKTFTRDDKAALGKRCKLVLDTARAYRLQELGYRVKFVRYTTMSIEDHLLIAVPSIGKQP